MSWQDKKDLAWISIVAALLLVWSSLPTWAGQWAQTSDLHFRGIYFDAQDYSEHISMMRSGMQGQWGYELRFTSETQHPTFVRLFYVILGHVSAWTALAPERTFELARWILGFAALFAIYDLFRRVFPDRFWARTGFFLCVLGSGLGWIQLLFHWVPGPITPVDFWLIDAYVFFTISLFPHLTFAVAAACLGASLWLSYLKEAHWLNIAGIALISIIVQFVNPVAFAVVDFSFAGAALFAWWQAERIRWPDIRALLILALAQALPLLYNLLVFTYDPVWRQFTAQNQTLSPPLPYYVWGFAPFWLPAIGGAWSAIRERLPALGAAIFWVLSGLLLAYSPFLIQRRFLLGITIPLALLSTAALIKLVENGFAGIPSLKRIRSRLVLLIILVASLSTVYLGFGRVAYLQTHPAEFYYPAGLDQAAQWLEQNAPANDLVLASDQTAQIVAQKTDLRVYSGHENETLYYYAKRKEVLSFYSNKVPADWIGGTSVKWVVYGPLEQEINPDFVPPPNLELVYDSQGVQIFAVQ
ncbi:MAG TPA: hypothetical protein VLZ89_09730 [Anaerolineales bacterium]|nr:hypothetical protein [Anaerolineales bacterium]